MQDLDLIIRRLLKTKFLAEYADQTQNWELCYEVNEYEEAEKCGT